MKPDEIRAFRARHDLTQKTLARLLGVSLRAVGWWEAGKRKPAPYLARAIQQLDRELSGLE